MPEPTKKTAASMAANWNDYSYTRAMAALTVVGDPDIVLQQLGKPRHSLRTLETDDEISAALETRREAVLSTSWNLVGDDKQRTEQVRPVLEYWLDDILRGAWNSAPYGYSVLRAGWYGGNRPKPHPEFGIVAPIWIGEWPMEQFSVTADGRLKYRRMDTGQLVQADAPEFFLTRRNATWRNPYGEALLSRLYWPWFFRYNGWRFWMQFVERYGDPLITGKVNSPQDFVKAAQENGFASVLAVNEGEDIGVEAPSSGDGHQRLINELDRRIQKVILGQTLTTSTDGNGSYAAAKVHNDVRQDKRLADLRLVRRTVQQVVDWIWRLNGWEGRPAKFEFDVGVSITPDKANALKSLKEAGWQAQEQLLGRIFGDVKPGDFELVTTDSAPGQNGSTNLALAAGSASKFTPAQQVIENMIDASVAASSSPIPAQELQRIIAKAQSPEHLDELLSKAAIDADTAAYRELLERALFAADVFGYVAADKRNQ